MKRFPRKKGAKDKNNLGWVRNAIYSRISDDQLWSWFEELETVDKMTFIHKIAPKEIENKGESGIVVRFELNGVRSSNAIDAQVIKGQLNPPSGSGDDPE